MSDSKFGAEVGGYVVSQAMQNEHVQTAVKQEAKKQFWSKLGFSSSSSSSSSVQQPAPQQEWGAPPPYAQQQFQQAPGVDESVIPGIDDAELERIVKWAKILRVAMILVSTLCIVTAFYNLATTSNTVATNFLAVYVFFFSTLVCCYEVALKQVVVIIVQNFGFLYNPVGRTIFVIFLAILLFQLSVMGMVMFAILLFMGIVQIYVDCKHPKFEKYKQVVHYFGKATAEYRSAPPADPNGSMTV